MYGSRHILCVQQWHNSSSDLPRETEHTYNIYIYTQIKRTSKVHSCGLVSTSHSDIDISNGISKSYIALLHWSKRMCESSFSFIPKVLTWFLKSAVVGGQTNWRRFQKTMVALDVLLLSWSSVLYLTQEST